MPADKDEDATNEEENNEAGAVDEGAIEDDALEEGEGEEGEEAPKKKRDLKTLLMMACTGILGLVVVGGIVAFLLGALDPLFGIEREKTKAEFHLGEPVTHELPEISVDLKTGRCRSPYLRAIVVVQLGDQDLDKLESKSTEVIDGFTTYLRDQERQDLTGKAGSDKLRFDMVRILNNILAPARVHGVLFKQIRLQ